MKVGNCAQGVQISRTWLCNFARQHTLSLEITGRRYNDKNDLRKINPKNNFSVLKRLTSKNSLYCNIPTKEVRKYFEKLCEDDKRGELRRINLELV